MLNLTSWILGVMANILSFETASSGLFVGVAQSAMTAVGLVLVMMFAAKASQSLEYGGTVPVGGFITIGLKLGLCLAVVGSWTFSAPGLGSPLGTFIPNLGIRFAQMIGWSGAQDIASNVASWSGMEMPGTGLSNGTVYWLLAQVILLAANLSLALVLIGPLSIVAGLILIGPLFVPMWIVPELTACARGYLRCLITYSLVPVIAAAAMRIIAQILLPSVGQLSGPVTSVETALPQIFMLCISLVATIWILVTCVKVANHITSGSSGAGTGWLGAGFAAVRAML